MTLENLRKAMLLNNMEMLLRLKKYLHVHENLPVLDKLAVTEDGHFTFEGSSLLSEIDVSKADGNAIEKKSDGYYVAANNPTEDEIQKMINEMWKELMKDVHNYSTTWSTDAVNHWHACTDEGCDAVSEKAPHSFNGGVVTLQPTFETKGNTTYTCTVCGYTKEEPIDMLLHSYADTYSSDENNHWHPCTDPGYQDLRKDSAAHDWDDGEITTSPTYDAEGVRTYHCTVCGHERTSPIAQLVHNYETTWTIDETYHWLKCSDDGYEDLAKDKAEHVYNEGVITTPTTFESDGVKTYTCSVCGHKKTEVVPQLEHSYAETWNNNETKHWHACTDKGYENLIQDEAEHSYDSGEVTVLPTFEKDGMKTYTCSVCGYKKTEVIPKLQHSYANDWSSDDDYHWHQCSDEGYEDLTQDKAIHDWDEGIITKEATADEEGVRTYTCSVCNKTKTEVIPIISNNDQDSASSENP